MTSTSNTYFYKVVKLAQEILSDEPDMKSITPQFISGTIDRIISINPKWGDDLNMLDAVDELIRRFSMWIGKDTKLVNERDHIHWLNASRKHDWRYWQRYGEWLERGFSIVSVESMDSSTDMILALLEDPLREGPWDRRGLVVGHVQSGKTSNYAGLICKAADAGYKMIVVLAGLHNNLRAQTQARLDEAFLGYETGPSNDDLSVIGVGEIDSDPAIRPNYATNRSENGDFSTKISKHLGITPENLPWLFVVKKNKTVLDRLFKWIRNHVANSVDKSTGKKVVTHLPLLIIDDEADHASVDTGAQMFDSDGHPDEDHEPKAINRLIRRILSSFSRTAYVGYTATPFANIFIHERARTREEGDDLFPSSFIISLAAPSNYVGPARVFGLQSPERRTEGLPLIRSVTDHANPDGASGWIPQGHRNGHRPLYEGSDTIPSSLVEAIDSFALSCATRILRRQHKQHSSMLIHVTRFNSVQKEVTRQVEQHIRDMRQRMRRGIGHHSIMARLKNVWTADFLPTNFTIREIAPDLVSENMPAWDDLIKVLPDVLDDIQVMTINGLAREALEYTKKHDSGMKVIAVGGDKLSRGLTLEGLTTSYFLRASRMYDTLMQMGRWFGYRPGYLDLCRLYTTGELVEWFQHIADASEELRQEFDMMATIGATPREYGLKVQSHPVLMVTSRLKMRSAMKLSLSYSGTSVETVALYRDGPKLQKNIEATRNFLYNLGRPHEINPERNRGLSFQRWMAFVWNSVPADSLTDFLTQYKTHPAAHRVNSDLICEFIQSMVTVGELTAWTVVLVGGGNGGPFTGFDDIKLTMVQRKANTIASDRYSIGRLLSPRDEAIDLDEPAWIEALELTRRAWRNDPGRLQSDREPLEPYDPAIRRIRGLGANNVPPHPERGLLLLYVLDPVTAGISSNECPPVAFGISFPSSNSGRKVDYWAQHQLWEQEYGFAE